MGLMDMYSTVLAGSPGHYGRSDGNGTVAQHVANMVSGVTPTSAHSVVTPSHNPYGFALDSVHPGPETHDKLAEILFDYISNDKRI
ncbi:hypothetical protein EBT25_14815 [bacterium]|nr:hypothetical protein [bacterium]